ncbi:MAG: hypothetical protein COB67_08640 [SAR324 cluster bacterium]|uniref:Polysaccharide chain length determinant N-terminal domain-containing protein n=1 Tax=SAR324 cluster bacterium TaxID=2024889 RepID=A0A2A4T1H9_9DELT|nr:MAG: hypothetical protein COB67_08640 [SAR324 cluster bacterium]
MSEGKTRITTKADVSSPAVIHPLPAEIYTGEVDRIDFQRILKILWFYKILISTLLLFGSIYSLYLGFQLKRSYEATSTFVPLTKKSGSGVNQFAGIASMLGVNIPGKSSNVIDFKTIMKSRSFTQSIIEKLDLLPAIYGSQYNSKERRLLKPNTSPTITQKLKLLVKSVLEPEQENIDQDDFYSYENILMEAADTLRQKVLIEVDRSGLYSITIEWDKANGARDIANTYIQELQKYLDNNNLSSIEKSLTFIEKQFNLAKKKMESEEHRLRIFTEKQGFLPKDYASIISESIKAIRTQIELEEVKLSVFKGVQGENSVEASLSSTRLKALYERLIALETGDVTGKRSEFKSFSTSLTDLPLITMEYAQILRELTIQQEIYKMLRTQLETARIESNKNSESIHVIDWAIKPKYPAKSKRKLYLVLGIIISLSLGIFLSFLLNSLKEQKSMGSFFPKSTIGDQ